MIIVADMGPLHYLVLIGAQQILSQLFTRVLTPPAVIAEMSHPDTPEPVRQWAASPPEWLEIKEPAHIEDMKRRDRARKQAPDESAHAPGPPEE
jgi:hypothetical protein